MFDQITSGGMSGALRGSSMLVSIAAHGALVAVALALAYYKVHAPKTAEPVVVTFRAPAAPPPPLAGHRTRTPRETPKRRPTPKVPPTSIVHHCSSALSGIDITLPNISAGASVTPT